jgi:hypothetical protein
MSRTPKLTEEEKKEELISGMRNCVGCRKRFPLTKFDKHPASANGRYRKCMECRNLVRRIRYYRPENRERFFEQRRKGRLKARYGISVEQYNKMTKEQNGLCAICKNECPKYGEVLSVDHCHETGRVRALLCDPCNRLLACARDSEEVLKSAIEYLEKH